MKRRTPWAVALMLVAVLFGRTGSARADDVAPYPDGMAPVYLIVSLTPDFDTASTPGEEQTPATTGSKTILLNVGTMVSGGGILNTRFVTTALSKLPLPNGVRPADLSGNDATILGSFETTDFSQVHMVTPQGGFIPGDIQEAVHEATRWGALDALAKVDGVPQFPTTYAIASAIAEYLPRDEGGNADYSVTDVSEAVFGPTVPLSGGTGIVAVQSEGELFPHTAVSAALFNFSVTVTTNADVTSDVCLRVPIVSNPGHESDPINRKGEGDLPVAILSTADFDATLYKCADIRIDGVKAECVTVKDVNGDGLDDLIAKFEIEDLREAGALDLTDTSLTLEGTKSDGTCIEGTTSITVEEKSCDGKDKDGDKDKCDKDKDDGKGKDKDGDKDKGKDKDKDDGKDKCKDKKK